MGRDVESMVRDLADRLQHGAREKRSPGAGEGRGSAEDRLLDLLIPPARGRAEPAPAAPSRARHPLVGTRDKLRRSCGPASSTTARWRWRCRRGGASFRLFAQQGMEEMGINLRDMLPGLLAGARKTRGRSRSPRPGSCSPEEEREAHRQGRGHPRGGAARRAAGIIFLDEIDKVAGRESDHGPDVSREGVQRDLLPIVEGTSVTTNYGLVRTDHVLFIAAGAFHMSKPSDLIPELQGRFPIRVELSSLSEDDFVRILTEPRNALIAPVRALLATEGVTLAFTGDAVGGRWPTSPPTSTTAPRTSARAACHRLENLLDEVAFDAGGTSLFSVTVDAVRPRRLEPCRAGARTSPATYLIPRRRPSSRPLLAPSCPPAGKGDPSALRKTPPALFDFRFAQRGDVLDSSWPRASASIDGVARPRGARVPLRDGNGQPREARREATRPGRPGAADRGDAALARAGDARARERARRVVGRAGARTVTKALVVQPPLEPPRELQASADEKGAHLSRQGVLPEEVAPPPVGRGSRRAGGAGRRRGAGSADRAWRQGPASAATVTGSSAPPSSAGAPATTSPSPPATAAGAPAAAAPRTASPTTGPPTAAAGSTTGATPAAGGGAETAAAAQPVPRRNGFLVYRRNGSRRLRRAARRRAARAEEARSMPTCRSASESATWCARWPRPNRSSRAHRRTRPASRGAT